MPNLLRSLVADSALSAAFVPVFTELEEQGRAKEAQRLAGAFIGLITMASGLISLLAIIVGALWLMPFFAPGLDQDLVERDRPPRADHVPDRRAARPDRARGGACCRPSGPVRGHGVRARCSGTR